MCAPAVSLRIARIASTPLIVPSCRSISVTSGRYFRCSATASSPDAAERDDLHVGLPVDDERDAFADDAVIVHAEHANPTPRHRPVPRRRADCGTTVLISVPAAGARDSTTSVPPISAARSFMVMRP